ncbi:hypothetical protein VF09_37215 [Nostoc linckia z9]|nr:hypothetical protein VF09_37215 [Nostoc linckia z9]
MGGHRLAGPDGAGFGSGVVADGEDEIELRRAGYCELVPVLRTGEARVVVHALQKLQRVGVNFTLRLRAGRIGLELASAEPVEDGFGDDRAGGIAGAEEEHMVDLVGHGRSLSWGG